MKGTPKQIAWAEKIQKDLFKNIERKQKELNAEYVEPQVLLQFCSMDIVDYNEHPRKDSIKKMIIQEGKKVLEEMMKIAEETSEAKWFIENQGFGNIIPSEYKKRITEKVRKIWA